MSIRSFIQRTRLLLEQGLYESRRALTSQDETTLRPLEFTQLEERILLSASPVAAVIEAPQDSDTLIDAAADASEQLNDQQFLDVIADSVLPPAAAVSYLDEAVSAQDSASQSTLELVFLESTLETFDQMLAELQTQNALDDSRNLDIVVLDSERDGIAQITAALLRHDTVDGIHVVSHGSDGQVQLGTTTLSMDNLESYRSAIKAWRYSLSASADIMFYGGDLGATENGRELMNQIGAASQGTVSVVATSAESTTLSSTAAKEANGDQAQTVTQFDDNQLLDLLADELLPPALNTVDVARELVFIDASADNYDLLTFDLLASDREFDVVILDSSRDGISQITSALSRYRNLDAIHIVSHGNTSGVQLGSTWLNGNNLAEYEAVLADWNGSLTGDADILFYGCDLAGSANGRQLLNDIGKLTGADVAGSTDETGHESLGGDWVFEYHVGLVSTDVAFSSSLQSNWVSVLEAVAVSTTADVVSGDADLSSVANLKTTPGSDGVISLREAIIAANALADADDITLAAGTYLLTGAAGDDAAVSGDLDITQNVTITGLSAGTTIIDAGGNGLTAGTTDRVFHILGGTVSMSDLTVTGGDVTGTGGGGFRVDSGDLTLTDVAVDANAASDGGGIYSNGVVTFVGGTISNNDTSSNAGGVWTSGNGSDFNATNVTISNNTTTGNGGGVYNTKLVTLQNVTITENTAAQGAGIHEGGGAATNLRNTIVAGNFGSSDVSGGASINSLGNNLIGDPSSSSGWVGSDYLGVAPTLGALADNGGPTQTHALLASSLYGIDQGSNTGLTTDQRGTTRDAVYDIGAFEFVAGSNVSFTISSTLSISEDLTETATFTVTLGGEALVGGTTASVDITATGTAISGTDYDDFASAIATAAGATAGVTFDAVDTLTFDSTFNGGTGTGAFAFTVDAIDDPTVEGTETIVATLSNPTVTSGTANFGTVSDSFTESSNTVITAHTPDTGLSWTEYFNDTTYDEAFINASLDVIEGGPGTFENDTGQAFAAGPAPTGVDQTISFTLSAIETDSGTKPVGLFGRSSDINNFYYLRVLPNAHAQDSISLWKMVAGVPTLLDSIDVTIAAGDTFQLQLTDATKKIYHNDSEVLSSTDNALTAAGNWGFYIGDFNGVGGHHRYTWNIDDFHAEDASSVVTASTNITESDVNVAPVLSGANDLTAINEDPASNPGTLISTLIAGHITDPDTGAIEGIAVTAVDNTNGTWEYTTNNGGVWTAFGSPSDSAARLLADEANTLVRFVPNANWNGTVTNGLTFRAWDQFSGAHGGTADTSGANSGGSTAFSSAIDSASVTVNPINDAPILDASQASLWLSTINDVAGSSAPGLANWTDGEMLEFGAPDLSFGENTTTGTFSSTGFNLDAFAGDADIDALHYVTQNVTVGSGINAIDLLTGDLLLSTQSGETLVSTNSLTVTHEDVFVFRADTPGDYSTGTFLFLLDKPTGGATMGVSLVEQDTVVGDVTLNAGTFVLAKGDKTLYHHTADTVGELTTTGTLTTLIDGPDLGIDENITGVALVQTPTTTGGVTLNIGQLLVTLAGEDNSVGSGPVDTERQDIIALTITQTGATTVGDATLFFDGDDVALASNDEDIDGLTLVTQVRFNPIIEDISGVVNTGTLVSELINNLITDVELDADGIAITAVTETDGTWEYSINGGSTWQAIGTVADNSARVLSATANDVIRFVPDPDFAGNATLDFRAWDGTDGSSSGTTGIDASTNGGSTAFSAATASGIIEIRAVNDAPVHTVPVAQSIDEDIALVFFTGNGNLIAVNDDALDGEVQITLTATNGTLTLAQTTGLSFTAGGDGESSMTFFATVADANAALDGMSYLGNAHYNGAATLTIDTDDQGHVGTGTSLSDSDVVNITVNAVNDAPDLDASQAILWLSTTADVSGSAAPGLANWTDGEMLAFGAPDLSFGETTTAGTFSSTGFNLDAFAGDANIDALHYVRSHITIGSGTAKIELRPGDLLFSTQANETLVSSNTLTVASKDLVLFSADTPGDYSAGTFQIVLDDPLGGEIKGAALVEINTTVGDANLLAGEFVLAKGDQQLYHFTADTVGETTTGGTLTTFVDGPDLGINENIIGVDLIQQPTTIGGITLPAGRLLVTLDNEDNSVGTGPVNTERRDVIELTITQTGTTTIGDAALFFDGDNVNLASNNEDLDALTLVPQPRLDAIDEDISSGANTGTLVSDLTAGIGTDADGNAVGIAITAVDETIGTWEYSINGGTTWLAVGSVADNSALVLTDTASDLIRFVPNAEAAGTATISFRAWDGTDANTTGTSSVDTSTNGAATAFSVDTVAATIEVRNVNDAPVLDNTGNMSLTAIGEDDFANSGDLVSDIIGSALGDRITDADSGAVEGLAVTAIKNANGVWEYSTNGGGNWTAFGIVSDSAATLITASANDRIRFVPTANFAGPVPAGLTFRAWDTTDGNANGATGIDTTVNGGATSFSSANETASITVTPDATNEAPLNTIPAGQTIDEDSSLVFSLGNGNQIKVNDDSGSDELEITLAVSNGTLTLGSLSGLTFTGGGNGLASMTFTATLADTNAALEGLTYQPDADFDGAETLTITSNDQGFSGSGGAMNDVDVIAITVDGLNDAPILSVGGAEAIVEDATITFNTANSNRISLVDVDSGTSDLEVTLVATHGTLTLSGITGLSFTVGDGTADPTMTFRGTAAELNAALDGMLFTPDSHYAGAAILDVLVDDRGNTGTGGSLFDRQVIDITISADATNDAPINTVPGAQFTNEDTALELSVAGGNAITVSDDSAGNPIEVTLTAANGALTLDNRVGPEFTMNTTTGGTQKDVQILTTAIGTGIAVWNSNGQDGSGEGIFAQMYDSQGVALGVEFPVNTFTVDHQRNPEVAAAADGSFVVVWQSKVQDGVGEGIYGQRFDASGNAVGLEFAVNTFTADDQQLPAVAMNAAGEFVVTWQSKNQDGDGEGIYAQLYDSSGNPIGGELLVNSTTADNQKRPDVAIDSSGNFVVVWDSKGQDADKEAIIGRRFEVGTGFGAEFQINSYTTSDQKTPVIAMQSTGEFVVAWSSNGQDGSGKGIFAQRFDNSTVPMAVGPEFQVNTTTTNNQQVPTIAMNSSGDFTIAWQSKGQDNVDGKEGVYARHFAADGTPRGDEFQLNTVTPGNQRGPSVSLLDDGSLWAAWDNKEIFSQRFQRHNVFTFTVGDGRNDATMTFSGTQSDINAALNGLIYRPNGDFSGSDTVTITTIDNGFTGGGSLTDVDAFTINVAAYNDAPVITVPVLQSATEDVPLVFSTGNSNLISISDDTGAGLLELTLTATNGTMTLSGTTGLAFSVGDGTSDATMTFQGTQADINAALEGLSFTSPTDYVGLGLIRLTADDLGNTGIGGSLVDSAAVYIDIVADAVNDAPTILPPGDFALPIDTGVTFDGVNLISILDDADQNSIELTLTVTNGTVTFNEQIDPEHLVNTVTADAQLGAVVAAAPNGSYVIVWQSKNQDGNGEGIFAQVYDAFGMAQGAEIQVNTEFAGNQITPTVAMDSLGNFVVAWESDGNLDGDGRGIFVQMYSADGQKVDVEFQGNATATEDQTLPAIAMDDLGNFVLVWQSKNQDGAGEGVFAQRFDSAGYAIDDEFQVNTTFANDQTNPAVAVDANGDFVVVWTSRNQDGDGDGIYGQRFDVNGVAQGLEFQVNFDGTKHQLAPTVAIDALGNFVVAWQSENQDGDGYGIYSRRFDSLGNALDPADVLVNTYTTKHQIAPSISMNAVGEYVIGWQSQDQDTNGEGTYGQWFNASGTKIGSEVRLNTTVSNDQTAPSVAITGTGDYIAAWTSRNQDGSSDGIFARQVASPGGLNFTTGDGVDDGLIVVTGRPDRINAALDGMTFTPTPAFNGLATVQIDVDDLGFTGSGGAQTDTHTIKLVFNTAPTLDNSGTPALTSINEDDVTNSGDLVSAIIAFGAGGNPITDADPGASEGIAVTSVDDTNGTWEYSTNGGGLWTAFGAVTDSSAVVLGTGPNDRIRFVPNTEYSGTVDPGLTFRAWDQIDGLTSGTTAVDTTTNGGSTPFSAATETASIVVNIINDIPTDIAPNSFAINENINTTGGYSLGVLTTTDADAVDTFTYTIQPGGDGVLFSIGGVGLDELFLDDGMLDFETKASYSVNVRVTDSASNTYDETLTVIVNDVTDTLVVDTTNDVADGTTTSIAALLADKGADGFISLREAMAAVNATTNGVTADEIHFNISTADAGYVDPTPGAPLSGDEYWVMQPTSDLPHLIEAVIIDASTQSGYVVGSPVIELDGTDSSFLNDAFTFLAGSDGSEVRGFSFTSWMTGIVLGSDNNTVAGNHFGINAAGAAENNFTDGIRITGSGNTIGGSTIADRNVISNSNSDGIQINSGANNNVIQGNYIGTDVSGTIDVGNNGEGINVNGGANNTIGGTSAGAGNVISGNNKNGILLWGPTTTGNTIVGNIIGLNESGSGLLGNTFDGVHVGNSAYGNTIGGDQTAGAGNVISGNEDGVEITTAGSDNNLVYGNFIGTNFDGTVALGNTRHGVVIYHGVQGTQIGGTGTGQGNTISGNDEGGIVVDGNGLATSGNAIFANLIGVAANGTSPLGNTNAGIEVFGSASDVLIGGTTAGAGNVIANNSDGIVIETGSTGISVLGNSIHDNTEVGIDLTSTSSVHTSFETSNAEFEVKSDAHIGQTFSHVSGNGTYTVNRISLQLREVSAASQFITVSLRDSWNGTVLGSATLPSTALTGSMQWHDLDFAAVTLTDGTSYTIRVESDLITGGVYVARNSGGGYASGDQIDINGSPQSGEDMLFRVTESGLGVTANDTNDGDSGANDQQNYPVITTADLDGTNLTLSGSLDTDGVTSQYRLEFFGTPLGSQDPTHGEGRYYLGTTTVTTDGSGDATFSGVVLNGVTLSVGDYVTATATRIDSPAQVGIDDHLAYGSTSEFAANFAIALHNLPPTDITPNSFGVNENTNTTGGYSLGALTTTDPDTGESFTYSIQPGGDGALFSIGGVGLDELFIDDGVLDFETKASYSVNVRVTDSDTNTYDETLTVNVNDINEAPTVTLTPVVTNLNEDTDTSSPIVVATITVNDDALGSETLTLSGTDAALFEIVGNDLRLVAGATLDFETNGILDVTVNVDDATIPGNPDDFASHAVTINDINEAPTVTLTPVVTNLNEDADTSSPIVVATITVNDDALGSETLTLSGTDAALFEIVGNDLRLVAGATLDFETNGILDVTVNVDDATIPGNPDDFASHAVTINDVNEAPTVTLTPVVTNLNEDADTSSPIVVATITVNDDALGSETLTLSGTDAALFEIVGNDLRLVAGATLDFETNGILDVTVNVDDATIPGSPDDFASHAVTINDVNEAPTVTLTPVVSNLNEDTDTSSPIVVATITVNDDALGSETLTLSGTDAALFEIVGNDLRLVAGATLDFETNGTLDVTVNVDDATIPGNPDDFASHAVTINDVNEAPTVTLTPVVTNLNEDTDTSSPIVVATITVNDDALGSETLTLSGSDAALFEIVGNDLRLIAGATLDFETNGTLDVTVNVDDATIPGSPDDFASHAVTINDVNEAPTVTLTPVVSNLNEDTDTSSPIVVATITVNDDALGSETLTLSGSDAALFEIVGNDLRLIAGATLDFETNGILDVTVNVDDATIPGNPDDFASHAVTINDINEAPTVTLTPVIANLNEDADTSGPTVVATIAVNDDALGSETLSLSGADAALFEIVGNDLRLVAGATLDFETNATLDVTVNVDDATIPGNPDDFASHAVTINDVNEAPTVTLTPVVTNLNEDTDTSSPIIVATIAVNDDALGSETLTLSGTDATMFEIVGTDLRLKAGTALDFETNATLDVTVNVDDAAILGNPDDFDTHAVAVNDVNEAPTVILTPVVTNLNEDADTSSPIVVATITVNDDALGSETLTLSGTDAAMFEIVGNDLRLVAGATLDFETNASLDVTVNVDDATIPGNPDDFASHAVTINDVNDAPTLNNGNSTAVNEDTASPAGEAVSIIFTGQFSDIDSGSSMSGIAVIANTSNAVTEGVWQYSTNAGANWFDIGTVADDNTALAISSATLIRFVPIADYNGAPTGLTVRGLDNSYVSGFSDTAGSETRVSVDTTSNGGTTSIAASVASLDTSITAVNDAPTLSAGTLTAVSEDSANPAGEDVSTIFSGKFSDVDAASSMSGIAVVGNATNAVTEGTWQYSTNTGTNWFAIGSVADNNTALAISTTTLVRFVPVTDYNGAPTGLVVRGLDNSYVAGFSDTAGSETRVTVDTTINGGTTAIAAGAVNLATSITAINDAPVLGNGTLTAVSEDTTNPAGEAVSTIFSGQFSDIDAGSSLSGIAVIGNAANSGTEGSWQYSTNAGTNWFDVGTVADNNTALAISSATLVRFVPVGDYNGAPTGLTVRGLDNSYVAGFSDTTGSETRFNVDTSSNGGTTAIAATSASLDTSITAVNDVPTLTSFTAVVQTTNEDTEVEIRFSDLVAQGDEADVDGTVDAFVVKSIATGTLKIGTSAGTATAWTAVTNETIDATRHAYWTPATDANGTLNAFGVVAKDNTGAESVSSVTAQVSVTNVNDAPTGSVTVDNTTPAQGDTLTASDTLADADGLGTIAYTWKADGSTVGTGTTYLTTEAEVGRLITVEANYTDGHGTSEIVSSAATAAVSNINDAPTGSVTVDNTTPAQGDTLTASNTLADADGLGTIAYTWKADGSTVGTGATYTLTQAEVGQTITVEASYTDGQGTLETVSSAATDTVTNVNDAPVGIPVIAGTIQEDQLLTADTSGVSDADGLGVYSFQWLRDGSAIGGATSSTYMLGDADVGAQISVEVRYTDGGATAEGPLTSVQTTSVTNVNDAPAGIPAITGTIVEDQILTADTSGISDVDGLGVFSYQWLRDGSAVSGATSSNYTLSDADVGGLMSVEVSYTDAHGTAEGPLVSIQTAAVANVNDVPVGIPTITGIVAEDQILTADTSGISDADGLGAFSYQWLRDGSALGLANSSTYTLGDADVGTQISVEVRYTDGGTTAEGPLTSVQTAAVANVNDEEVLAVNSLLIVNEGDVGTVIPQTLLETTDVDNTPSQLVYNLTTVPGSGTLRLSGTPLISGSTVSQADINAGLLTYDHDDSEVFTDSFAFSVDDGSGATSGGVFNIQIDAVNDNNPVITSDGGGTTAAISVAENSATVTTVTGTDVDRPVQTLTYAIAGGTDLARFSISGTTGELTFATAPDFETAADANGDNVYEVIVEVHDGLGRTSQQTLLVTVTDVDEFDVTTIIDTDAAPAQVDENVSIGTAVGITAFSADLDGSNNIVTYSLDSDAGGLFTIDAATGIVRTSAAIDFEASGGSLNIVVRATSTDGSSTTRLFSIVVHDLNDNAPVITPGQLYSVSEFAAIGASPGTVVASDIDTVGTVQNWTIIGGNSDGIFAVHSTTGAITVADVANLNFETRASYTLTLTVDDGSSTSTPETVTVAIVDQNDAPILSPAGPFSVNENSASGTVVGSAAATDADAADILTYTLVNPGARFAIDSNTGQITVAGDDLLNFEDIPNHTVTVQVTDAGGLTHSQPMIINVNDVNEAPTAADDMVTASQSAVLAVPAGIITANDGDVDGDGLSVVLVSGPAHGTLALNSDGSFVYTLNGFSSGLDQFRYLVTDGSLISGVAVVEIDIADDIPVGVVSQSSVREHPQLLVPVLSLVSATESETESIETAEEAHESETTAAAENTFSVLSAVTVAESVDELAGLTVSTVAEEILRRTSSNQFVAIFLDAVPEESQLDEMLTARREREESTVSSHPASAKFLFDRMQAANPFMIGREFDLEQREYLHQQTDRILREAVIEKVVVGTTAVVSSSVSVAYAVWLLRGGSLLSTFLSSMPFWQSFDPLPVLDAFQSNEIDVNDDGDDETLLSMVNGGN